MEKKYLFFAGLPGSGKTHISSFFREIGVDTINLGRFMKDYLAEKYGVLKPGEYKLIERIIAEDPTLAGRTLLESTFDSEGIIVVESLKSTNDLIPFSEIGIHLLYSVFAPREERVKRVIERARENDVASMDELIRRDKREIGYGAGDLIRSADIKIENYWSDDLIQMIRLADTLKNAHPPTAEKLQTFFNRKYSQDTIKSKREESEINNQKAKENNYWIHEMEI